MFFILLITRHDYFQSRVTPTYNRLQFGFYAYLEDIFILQVFDAIMQSIINPLNPQHIQKVFKKYHSIKIHFF